MSVHPPAALTSATDHAPRPPGTTTRRSTTSFAVGQFVLAIALAVNTALGPLGSEVFEYPISGTLLNQTLGLEVVTVGLVVPFLVIAAVMALRGHGAAPFVGFGPAAYSAYMFFQYVLGPQYERYTSVLLFQTAVVALSVAMAIQAWAVASRQPLPHLTGPRRRAHGVVLLALAAFIISRYLPVVLGGTMPAEFAQARTFFWSIFLLDLGLIVPATVVAGIGVLRGSSVAHRASYALMGWYALVPASVAAMSTAMVVNEDVHAVPAQAVVLGLAAVLFCSLAAWMFAPLLRLRSAALMSSFDGDR